MQQARFNIFSATLVTSWLTVFALLPALLVLFVSVLSSNSQDLYSLPFTLNNYVALIDWSYVKILLRSLFLATTASVLCLLTAYPFAYTITKASNKLKPLLLLFVIIPFWTSSLIRTYAIMAILKTKGLLNSALLWLGIIHEPLQILYTNMAVFIGFFYTLLPFMILPLYISLDKIDPTLLEAARDLGANRMQQFLHVVLPQTKAGILTGIMLTFLPAMTLFYLPNLLGGAKSMLLGNLIQSLFLSSLNWPLGAAVSIMLLIILTFFVWVYARNTRRSERADLL